MPNIRYFLKWILNDKIKKELFTPNFQKIKEKSVYSSGQQMGQAWSSWHKKNLSEERFFLVP